MCQYLHSFAVNKLQSRFTKEADRRKLAAVRKTRTAQSIEFLNLCTKLDLCFVESDTKKETPHIATEKYQVAHSDMISPHSAGIRIYEEKEKRTLIFQCVLFQQQTNIV